MILCRTPLRVSFVGGGTDVPAFYRETPGAVLSTAIDRYLYVSVKTRFDRQIRLSYAQNETVEAAADLQHDLAREALALTGVRDSVEITLISDIPAQGTGMGSSSSCAVGLLNALHTYRRQEPSPEQLAQEACGLEIERCGKPIGKQDQYIAAYGGFCFFEFLPDERVITQRLCLPPDLIEYLHTRLLLFYTGITRSADAVLAEQTHNLKTRPACRAVLERLADLARTLFRDLATGQVETFGPILDEAWQRKRELAQSISSPQIDAWYACSRAAGAEGGKLLGAGGGGFLLLFVPPERQEAVRRALALPEMRFGWEPAGSRIVYRDPERPAVCVSS